MDMSGMDMSSSSTSSGSSAASTAAASTGTTDSMSMTSMGLFHSGTRDSLFWSSWTPSSNVAYAFTFLALVALGIASRAILAYMSKWERAVQFRDGRRLHVVVAARDEAESRTSSGSLPHSEPSGGGNAAGTDVSLDKVPVLRANSVSSKSDRIALDGSISPWRLSTDVPRGLLQFVASGLGYLLMLAVMTGNVGYFFAVLSGILIGEIGFGRLAHPPYQNALT